MKNTKQERPFFRFSFVLFVYFLFQAPLPARHAGEYGGRPLERGLFSGVAREESLPSSSNRRNDAIVSARTQCRPHDTCATNRRDTRNDAAHLDFNR